MSEAKAMTVVAESRALEPQTQRGVLTKDALAVASEQRRLLAEYVHQQMKDGTDYGLIPGTDRPALYKAGAEKLVELFRCTPQFELIQDVEDFDKQLFVYKFRVRLLQRDSDAILAEGYGSANSREGKYRWRYANLKCPTCKKETVLKSKDKPEYFCWKKRGGCGAIFPDKDPQIANQTLGKVENDDVATQANTILKMAKKRALVDGAVALARVSDLFTQDIEDAAPEPELHKPKLVWWQEVVKTAKEYGFDCGTAKNENGSPKNEKLWALTAKVTPIDSSKWTEEEFNLIEAALAAAMRPKAAEENDINF